MIDRGLWDRESGFKKAQVSPAILLAAFFVLSAGYVLIDSMGGITGLAVFEAKSSSGFDNGTYVNTNFNGSALVLNATFTNGYWTSALQTAVSTLDNISFDYRRIRGEFSGADERNVDYLNGLLVLYHFNNNGNFGESSSLVYDFTGQGSNATPVGTAVPFATGQLNV